MSVTSDRLRELTKRKLELIREIDKNSSNEALKDNLKLIEEEISRERTVVVYGRPEEKPAEAPAQANPKVAIAVKATVKKAAPKKAAAASKGSKERTLDEFFN